MVQSSNNTIISQQERELTQSGVYDSGRTFAKQNESDSNSLKNNPFQRKTVLVSGGVAGKINQQSIRSDSVYSVGVPYRRPIKESMSINLYSRDNTIKKQNEFNTRGYNSTDFFGMDSRVQLEAFSRKEEALKTREKRSEEFANVIVFNSIAEPKDAGRGDLFLRDFIASPYNIITNPAGFGGRMSQIFEKSRLTGYALATNSNLVLPELKRSAKVVEANQFSFLPGGTPINRAGYETLAFSLVGAGFQGYSLRTKKPNYKTAEVESNSGGRMVVKTTTNPESSLSVGTLPKNSNFVYVDKSIARINVNFKNPILGKVNLRGSIPRFDIRRGFYDKETFEIKGIITEQGKTTRLYGDKSQAPIISTTTESKLLLTNTRNQETFLAKTRSTGVEVNGIGNRITNLEVLRPNKPRLLAKNFEKNQPISRRIKFETIGKERFVERYAGVSEGDNIFGGTISKKGVSTYEGTKIYESQNKLFKKQYETSYDLESATQTNNIRITGIDNINSVYDVSFAGQSKRSYVSQLTSSSIKERLIAETPIRNPKIFDTTFSNEGLGLSYKTQTTKTSGIYQMNNLLKRSVVQATKTKVYTPDPKIFPLVNRNVQTSAPQKTFSKQESKSQIQSVQINELKIVLKSNVRIRSVVKVAVASTQRSSLDTRSSTSLVGQFSKVSPLADTRIKTTPNQIITPRPATDVKPITRIKTTPNQIITPRPATDVKPITRQITSQTPKIARVLIPNPQRSTVPSPLIPRIAIELNGRNSFQRKTRVRSVSGYTPSFSALYFKRFGTYRGGKLSRSGLDYRPITNKNIVQKLAISKARAVI